jgi:hypothetical protein
LTVEILIEQTGQTRYSRRAAMKNNQFTFILVGVFFLTTLGTVVLSYKFVNSVRTLQATQTKLGVVNFTKSFLNQLAADTAEYAKKDTGINAVIQPFATSNANPAAVLPKTPAK